MASVAWLSGVGFEKNVGLVIPVAGVAMSDEKIPDFAWASSAGPMGAHAAVRQGRCARALELELALSGSPP